MICSRGQIGRAALAELTAELLRILYDLPMPTGRPGSGAERLDRVTAQQPLDIVIL
jgi:hypothetical protein